MSLDLIPISESNSLFNSYSNLFSDGKAHLISFDVPKENVDLRNARLRINRKRVGCYCTSAKEACLFYSLTKKKFNFILRSYTTERAREVIGFQLFRIGENA